MVKSRTKILQESVSHEQSVYAITPEDQATAALIAQLVSLITGVRVDQIAAPTRLSAEAAKARMISMYLAYITQSWSLSHVANVFGRDRTTVGYACRQVEDLRDDPDFDALLDQVETCLKVAPRPRLGSWLGGRGRSVRTLRTPGHRPVRLKPRLS